MRKSFVEWIKAASPDVICLQEIKATPEQVDYSAFTDLDYHLYWYPAKKKGYSGTAIFSKIKPDHVEYGINIPKYDDEGRVIRVDISDLSIICAYFPSGSSGSARQEYKMDFLTDFEIYVKELRTTKPNLIVCGDYNICHKAMDIHNPNANKNSSGFLPEEREWMDNWISSGFIDTFRYFNSTAHNYTWWSYRSGARQRNLGWRIDYFMATKNLENKLKSARILSDAMHSDHCPLSLEILQ
ncbi:MAG: exodeoxyribonuclease-3 [Ulvibacter sp.]|jgi:exodeoxyribonuclease-3